MLAELKEYATEVDVDFVRKAVRAIGRCAIKVEVRRGSGSAQGVDLFFSLFGADFPPRKTTQGNKNQLAGRDLDGRIWVLCICNWRREIG